MAAFLGSVLTFSLSCRLTGTLLFSIIPLALSRPYLKANLPVSPFWPKWLNRIGSWLLLNVPLLLGNVRRAARDFGLPKPHTFLQLWEGDVNIVAEAQDLSLLKELPEGWYFSGPLFAHLSNPIPSEVEYINFSSISFHLKIIIQYIQHQVQQAFQALWLNHIPVGPLVIIY